MEKSAKNIVSDETFCIWKGCILNSVNHLQRSDRWTFQNHCPRAGVVGGAGAYEQKNLCLSTRAFSTSTTNNEHPVLRIITLMLLMLHATMVTNDARLDFHIVTVHHME